MKYRQLKNVIAMMNDKQLDQDVVVFKEDEEQGSRIDYYEKSKQSFFILNLVGSQYVFLLIEKPKQVNTIITVAINIL